MDANNGDAHKQGGDQNGSDAGQEDDEQGRHDEAGEDFKIGELAAEEDERLIGRAEDVEEKPAGEEGDEEEEGERIAHERDPDHRGGENVVIRPEIGVVLADAEGGFREGIRLGDGGAGNHLVPRTAVGKAIPYILRDLVYKVAESRGGNEGPRIRGCYSAGGGGGLAVRSRGNRRRRHCFRLADWFGPNLRFL
ncbi:unnamed protein product, partial [Cuscuta epithymum]